MSNEPAAPPHAALQGRAAVRLAVGVVLLEFATAVSTFVASTLLPEIERDLAARSTLPLLVAGTTVGMFTALPLATRIIRAWSPPRTLAGGLALSTVGSLAAAGASDSWMFAGGRLVAGFAGGVLAVYGISAAIEHLATAFRIKVIAAMSAMWLLPALVGPAATLGLEHAIGWRLTLLIPLPLMAIGRLLVVRAVPSSTSTSGRVPPLARSMLVPGGVAWFAVLSALDHAALGSVGLAAAGIGFVALMPPGTSRLRAGPPAALAGLTLFGAGYFGALSLITLLLTHTYRAAPWETAFALSAPQVAWSLVSLGASRLATVPHLASVGMGLTASGVGTLAIVGLSGGPHAPALVGWTLSGVGVGLAYPQLYVRATTTGKHHSAAQLATAAITSESFGGLVGASAAAAVASSSAALGITRADAFAWAYAGLAATLVLAAIASARSTSSD